MKLDLVPTAEASPVSKPLAGLYLESCVDAKGISRIANLTTQMAVLTLDGQALPVSINLGGQLGANGEPNSYVVSPTTAYGDYALDELKRLGRPLLFWPFYLLLWGLRWFLQRGKLDSIVQVNNWMLSTNLYPCNWTGAGLLASLPQLIQRFPDLAIGLRSLNFTSNAALISSLQKAGFILVPSRQVYLFDGRSAQYMRRHNNRLDQRLLRNCGLLQQAGSDFSPADFARAEQLYNLLYLDKYSRLNPHYSAAWLQAGQQQGWLQLCGLRRPGGELLGVVGWFELDGVITAPIVGYDTGADSRLGLYRLLTALCLKRATGERKLLNFSSGAAHFKRLRGGEAAIEYSLVYVQHLSWRRRGLWRLLAFLLRALAVPLLRKLQL